MRDLEHPEIGWIERTGYPSWMQESEDLDEELEESEEDEESEFWGSDYADRLYDEQRDRRLFGDF